MSIFLIWAVSMPGDLHWVILFFLRLYTSLKNPLNISYLSRESGRFFVFAICYLNVLCRGEMCFGILENSSLFYLEQNRICNLTKAGAPLHSTSYTHTHKFCMNVDLIIVHYKSNKNLQILYHHCYHSCYIPHDFFYTTFVLNI